MSAARGLRRVLSGGALVLVGAWLAVGLLPQLEDAGTWVADAESVEEDDPTDDSVTSVVWDPSDGTYDAIWTFANRGLAPVTIRLGENPGSPYSFFAGRLHQLDPQTYEPGDASDVVTVPPGGVFGVEFALGLGCMSYLADSAMGIDTVELAVTTLGLTRRVDVGRDETVMVGFTTDFAPPEGCMDQGRPQQPGVPAGW